MNFSLFLLMAEQETPSHSVKLSGLTHEVKDFLLNAISLAFMDADGPWRDVQ